jgi:hypothetical protein
MNGPRVYWILAVPVVAAFLTVLPWAPPVRRIAVLAAAGLTSVFVLLGLASVGLFFLPTAAALVTAAGAGRRLSRPAI